MSCGGCQRRVSVKRAADCIHGPKRYSWMLGHCPLPLTARGRGWSRQLLGLPVLQLVVFAVLLFILVIGRKRLNRKMSLSFDCNKGIGRWARSDTFSEKREVRRSGLVL